MSKTNLLVDLGVFAAFLVVADPRLTGIAVHEWLGVAFAATLTVHLLLHWRWIVATSLTFFRKLLHTSRLKLAVDALMFVAFTTVMMSGMMISRSVLGTFGVEVARNLAWSRLHSISADATLLLVGVHLGLSWSWMVGMVKRYLLAPLALTRQTARHPARVPVEATQE